VIRKVRCGAAIRCLKFTAVGGVGIVVQLIVLALLKTVLHVHYLIATGLAVEFTVLHNYIWHEQLTWVDRRPQKRCMRALKFNLTTGLSSMGGNLVLMALFVGSMHMRYLLANSLTMAICAAVNFLVSDRFVFRAKPTRLES
jgi:dolichol-phosphate mannosyltransferase